MSVLAKQSPRVFFGTGVSFLSGKWLRSVLRIAMIVDDRASREPNGPGAWQPKPDMCILLPIEQPAGKFGHTNTDTSRTILFASV
jgi:hypothetical protein